MKFPIFKYLALAGLTLSGALSYQATTQALSLDYDNGSSNPSSGSFVYDITLGTNETISNLDPLAITNLAGITNATAASIYTSLGAFDSVSANFLANANILSGEPRFYNNAITLTSTSTTLGSINYAGGSGAGSFSRTTSGPVAATAVPFEFSPGLGVVLSTGFLGMHLLRRKKPFSV